MKAAIILARVLLGLIFVVFGLNVFFHFINLGPLPQGQAGAFMGALFLSGYLYAVKVIEIVGGLLLLSGRFVPLGLTLLGPVIVNILSFDIFLVHAFNPLSFLCFLLEAFLIVAYRSAFARVFAA